MSEEKNIVNIEASEILGAEFDAKDALEIIETRQLLFDRMREVAIRSTNSRDWSDQGGEPYLESTGVEKAARRFGVRIFDVEIEKEDFEDDKGKYYVYTVSGKASISKRDTIEVIGTRSSRDKFFSKQGNGFKPIQDVDLPNIKKSAYTNFYVNAVTRLLGLRGLTWEELAQYGITKDGKASVKYDKGANKAEASKRTEQAEMNAKKPYWTSEYNDKTFLWAIVGDDFSPDFLAGLGFRSSSKDPKKMYRDYSEQIEKQLVAEIEAGKEVKHDAR